MHTPEGYREIVHTLRKQPTIIKEYDEKLVQTSADPTIHIEQRLYFSRFVPEGFSTGDSPVIGDGLLYIIDFKYGQGVLVQAEDNPQMKLYALGALEIFDGIYDISDVSMTIYQPHQENVSTILYLKNPSDELYYDITTDQ